MANFQPLKNRFIKLLEENISVFQISGRFIDCGCGRGDVAEYMIRNPSFKQGYAFDLAVTDEQIHSGGQREGVGDLTYTREANTLPATADLGFLLDVIEHVPDPQKMLCEIREYLRPEGWLMLTVPYNPYEWGVDDEFYGHLRRLSLRGMVALLENNGWEVIRLLDPTFPSFWFIRRVYLLSRRFSTLVKATPEDPLNKTDDFGKTLKSSKQCAHGCDGFVSRALSSTLVPWSLVRRFDLYFESVFRGFELFAVCRKRSGSRECGVCKNGQFTYSRFFSHFSMQKCTYCSTEKILSCADRQIPSRDVHSLRFPIIRRLLVALRGGRLHRLSKLSVPQKTMAILSRTEQSADVGKLDQDWTLDNWHDAKQFDDPSVLSTQVGSGRYGVVAMVHAVELFKEVGDAINLLDDLVAPGGYAYFEYPNSRSWLKKLLQWRWFGYDPPFHRYIIDSASLSDQMGLRNYRLVEESHFAAEYSFFFFAQSILNTLFPFQRDSLFGWLSGKKINMWQSFMAWISLSLLAILLPFFIVYQILASSFRRGCVVRQLYRKTDIT